MMWMLVFGVVFHENPAAKKAGDPAGATRGGGGGNWSMFDDWLGEYRLVMRMVDAFDVSYD